MDYPTERTRQLASSELPSKGSSGTGYLKTIRPASISLLTLAFLSISIAIGLGTQVSFARDLTVGPGGYSSISAAVRAASNGDVIRVHPGTYYEQVNVNKRVTIEGTGNGQVWIDGGCRRDFGIDVNASGVRIQDVGVRNANESAIRVNRHWATVVEAVDLRDWNCSGSDEQYYAGVACWYCTALFVLDSHIETRRDFGNGIWVKSTSSTPSAGYHVIRGNTIIGGFDGIGSESETDAWGGFVRHTLIENNTIRDCHDDGIQVEGRNQNVRVLNNTITGCDIGIAFAPNLVGPLYIEGNSISELSEGYYGVLACFKTGNGGSGTTYLTGNTCETPGDGLKQTNSGLSPIVARDNCLDAGRYVIELSSSPASGTSFDEDILWTSDPNRFVKWGGSTYSNIEELRSGAGQEANGVEAANCEEASEADSEPTATATPEPEPTNTPEPEPTATSMPEPEPTATTPPPPEDEGLVVGSGGYSTIQAAVNAASSGDTIRVRSGTYGEQVNVNKSVTLTAYGDGAVWIDGGCSQDYGIEVTASNVRVEGLGVTNTGEAGVSIGAVSNTHLEGMTIEDWNCYDGDDQFRAGVACWYCSGLSVVDSHLEIDRPYGNGIWVKSTNSQPTTGGHYIARNTIIGGFDGIGSEAENDEWGGFVRNTTIEDNIIDDCDDDGIQVEGRNENVTVRNNTITRCGIGIALAPNLVGPLYIEGNRISNLQPKYYGVQACFKVGNSGSGTAYLTANVCETTGDGIKQTNSGLSPIVARDNCLQVTRYVIELSNSPASGTSFDSSRMWTSDSGRFIKWGGTLYGSLSSFQSGTGQESNGVEAQGC